MLRGARVSPNKIMIYSLVLSAQVYACPGAMQAGTVSGRVMGPSGHPIPNARVYALYTNSTGPGRQTEGLADWQGNFLLKNVRAGRNEIHAYGLVSGFAAS